MVGAQRIDPRDDRVNLARGKARDALGASIAANNREAIGVAKGERAAPIVDLAPIGLQ